MSAKPTLGIDSLASDGAGLLRIGDPRSVTAACRFKS
jgi:hypothetical protein